MDLIAKRRLRMGDDPKKPFVLPGEIISQAQREKLGANRLRRWFENGTLDLAEFTAPEPQRKLALRERKKPEVFEPEKQGTVIEEESAGLDKVEQLVDEVIEPNVPDQVEKDQAREDRNRKARETRAANKAAKAKRDVRNRKTREKRARVNAGG